MTTLMEFLLGIASLILLIFGLINKDSTSIIIGFVIMEEYHLRRELNEFKKQVNQKDLK